MAVTLHELSCFLAAARTLHFGQAAGQLRISPSSLSEQIAKLERDVGRRLFEREARAVSLTRSGAELASRHACWEISPRGCPIWPRHPIR